MTDGTTTPDRHLDDETISAALDGEPIDDAARAHLDACATCGARLDAFRLVAGAVGRPVAPAPGAARETAIASALDGLDGRGVGGGGAGDRRNVGPWLAVAAVALLLLVAVPVIAALSSGRDTNDTASSGRDDSASATAGDMRGGTTVPDLGALDAANLAAVVGRSVGAQAPAPAPRVAPGAGSASGTAGGAPASPGAAGGEARATGGAAGAAGGSTAERSATADRADESAKTRTADGRSCAPSLQASGTEVLFAHGTWDGSAAAVFAYRDGDDVSAYVVNPPDCRILHFVRFRAGS